MAAEPARPIVIAHRGASGYLPEHTLAAKALAVGMGADYLEQDVVLTKDNRPIVLHDIHLDTVTDVATLFPERCRADGRYYAADFTWAEVKGLQVHERFDRGSGQPVFPARFPAGVGVFRVVSLAEEIEFVQGLSRSTGRAIGIYPEIKAPAWHRAQGRDISRLVLDELARYGYRDRGDSIFLQCFEPVELRRIRSELGCELRLVQLIGENAWEAGKPVEERVDYDAMRSAEGLVEIAEYADGIGPRIEHLLLAGEGGGAGPGLIELAHRAGLAVHPYTFRADALPQGVGAAGELLERLFAGGGGEPGVDGLFTDFPDVVTGYLGSMARR